MSERKPKVYGFCNAGCKWETVHKSDFDKSVTWVKQYPDENNVYELPPVKNYKIVAPVASNAYSCVVSLTYTDGTTAKTHTFTISEYDAYRDYFYFEILSLTATATALTVVYEVNGNRYTESVSGTAISITDAKLKIAGAMEVLLFNADANIQAEGGQDGNSVFIRYSANADGTDFTETWTEGQDYIGVYVGLQAPTSKESYDWIKFVGGSGGGDYTNATPTPAALGGVTKGETFDKVSYSDMFTKLLYPYVAFTINAVASLPFNGGVYEKGATKTITSFTVNLTKGSEKITKITVTYSGNEVASSESEDFGSGVVTLTPENTIDVKTNAYFNIRVEDAAGKWLTRSTSTISFIYPYYYGVADADATVNETLIKTFTKLVQSKGTKTVSYTANNQKMVFVSPYAVSKITDPNGFNVTDTFTMTRVSVTGLDGTAQSYYVYTANEASTVTNFNMTFTN